MKAINVAEYHDTHSPLPEDVFKVLNVGKITPK